MPNSYSMKDNELVEKLAMEAVLNYLNNNPETETVFNVVDHKQYRKQDIDLVWVTKNKDTYIEVKGDRYHNTGNFFFETISNMRTNSPGCFMYTEANYIYYFFPGNKVLYILPVKETREWFLRIKDKLQTRHVETKGKYSYFTEGKLVPISRVMKEVPGVERKELNYN